MSEKRVWLAVLQGKCPQCREGEMFTHPVSNLRKFGEMYPTCPKCGLQFEREPGFFYGAMYMSYTLSVGIFLTAVVVLYFLAGDPSTTAYISTITGVALILYPFTFKYSRILYLYLFGGVRYHPRKH